MPGEPPVAAGAIADAAMDGIGVVEGGEFSFANPGLAELHGFADPSELVGRPWEVLYDSGESERIAGEVLPVVREGEPWRGAATGLDADGHPFAQDLSIRRAGGDTLVWVVRGALDEPDSRVAERRRITRRAIDATDDILYVIDEEGQTYLWNDALPETTGYDHEEIREVPPLAYIPPDQHQYVPGVFEDVADVEDQQVDLDVITKDGRRIPHEFRGTTIEDEETGRIFRVGIARDVTERLERQRALERRRDELVTLNRLNGLLMEVTRELVETTDRAAVERTVCERLADSEFYQFAWIGSWSYDGPAVDVRANAGDDDGYMEEVADGLAAGPIEAARRSGEVHVVAVDDAGSAPWRDAAAERGIESVAVVPIQHAGTVFGVLALYATRPDAFSEREQAGFDILGTTVGFVINAIRRRKLLFADAVVELEFHDAGPGSLLVDLSAAFDCTLSLAGYVASGPRWLLYLDAEGADPDALVSAAVDATGVDHGRAVTDGDDGRPVRIELGVRGASMLQTVTGAGATIRSAVANEGTGRLVIEGPVSIDVREIADRVTADLPGSELVARRERDRSIEAVALPGDLLDELTDRQRQVLEAAYRAGYFDWPRASTAEEVADSLGIAAATLHAHVRKAESSLLGGLFDSDVAQNADS